MAQKANRRRITPVACRLLACGLLSMGSPQLARAENQQLAFAVKAAFITKFVPFVEWPDGIFYAPAGSVRICVVGQDPFGDLLDRVAAGQSIAGHPLIVQRLTVINRDSGCQIVFAAGSAEQPVADILQTVRGLPVLTMTDDAADAQSRGIINFVIIDNRVRFEIDDNAAAANGLTISSKLLSLAAPLPAGG